jgi:DNA polymerase iota
MDTPDQARVILHFDFDAFYAQVEELRNPELQSRPLAVTQKFLVVTCNYLARSRGVCKLMRISRPSSNMRISCPELELVSGEDLTPYRKASEEAFIVLSGFGPCQRFSMDEFFVDVTAQAGREVELDDRAGGESALRWHGHVHAAGTALVTAEESARRDRAYRVMDLRVAPFSVGAGYEQEPPRDDCWGDDDIHHHDGPVSIYRTMPTYVLHAYYIHHHDGPVGNGPGVVSRSDMNLQAGSGIASRAREELARCVGLRCSAGIAHNRMLSKLAGSHKPTEQTSLPANHAFAFLAPLPLRVLPGVGAKAAALLVGRGLETVAQLRGRSDLLPLDLLQPAEGPPPAVLGHSGSKVVPSGPPGRLSVEDSFKGCLGFEALEQVTRVLVPDLLVRAADDANSHQRQPGTLTVTYRLFGGGATMNHRSETSHTRVSRSVPAPSTAGAPGYVEAAMAVLRKNLRPPFHCTCLTLALSNFVAAAAAAVPLAGFVSSHAGDDLQQPAGSGEGSGRDMAEGKAMAKASRDFRSHYLPGSSHLVLSKVAERQVREGALAVRCPRVLYPFRHEVAATASVFSSKPDSTDFNGSRTGQFQCVECKAWVAFCDQQCHRDYHFAYDLSRTATQPTTKRPKLKPGSRSTQTSLGFKPLARMQ